MVGGGRVHFGGEVTASREIAPRILRVVTLADGETIHNMKLDYYPETDSLYFELKAGPGAETREVSTEINVDLDAEGNAVGFDIDQASIRLDLATLETEALPVRSYKAGWSVAGGQGPVVRGRWPVAGGRWSGAGGRWPVVRGQGGGQKTFDFGRLGAPRPRGFKEMLASCPVDLDLDRPRDFGRAVET